MSDRLIRITTALAVAAVAAVAAVISYRHAYELVSTHGGGLTTSSARIRAARTARDQAGVHAPAPKSVGFHVHGSTRQAQRCANAHGHQRGADHC
jgi:hypothetical protein